MVPIPVQLMLSTPGPKYSTIAPVPPFTVRIPANLRITSLGEAHPDSLPRGRRGGGEERGGGGGVVSDV